jgi:outer membrane protein assembly factor BamE (lipoprotein component of BamABCDE complex)
MKKTRSRPCLAVSAATLVCSCVTTDARTGETIPRGNQKYEVVERAEELRNGLSRSQVLLMLGSPAEEDGGRSVWVYLPKRLGVLIPARALRLEFENGRLIDDGYRSIVLGQRL